MANLVKYTKNSCSNLTRHFERNKEIRNYSNTNVDKSRSYLNYNLAPSRNNQLDFINSKCNELKVLNRKDVNVMCVWLITLPKDVSKENEDKFFKLCYEFLKDRYDVQDNIVSSYVHKDETTPHMHFAFIPVVYDNKKNRYKISAKELLTKIELKKFHGDLEKYLLDNNLCCEILNEATKEGNKSIKELKFKSARERLEETKLECSKMTYKAQQDLKIAIDNIKLLENKKNALEDEINTLKIQYKVRQLKTNEILNIKPRYEKGLLGLMNGIKGVTISDIENLKATALNGLEAFEQLRKLTFEYEKIKSLVPTLEERMQGINNKLRLKKLEELFQKLPEDIKEKFIFDNFKNKDRNK